MLMPGQSTLLRATALPWQLEQWSRVIKREKEGGFPHALMLTGTEGIGKLIFCRALAHWLLCAEQGDSICGVCRSCELNQAETHPDLSYVNTQEKSSVIKIEQIRELRDYISKTPQIAPRKVICLGPAEALNNNAANAFLKSLEEPSPSTILLLYCHRLSVIPATIRSRCQLIEMPIPQKRQAEKWLMPQIGSLSETQNALDLANGKPIRALQLCDAGMLDQYANIGVQLKELYEGSTSAVSVIGELKNINFEDVLAAIEIYLHDTHRNFWLFGKNHNSDLKPLLAVIEYIQQIRGALQKGTNPNRQLTLEKIFFDIKSLSWS